MMTRYSIPANTADYCPTDSDYLSGPEPAADDWQEWSDWLAQTENAEAEMSDAAYAAHRAAVLARWGSDEAPF